MASTGPSSMCAAMRPSAITQLCNWNWPKRVRLCFRCNSDPLTLRGSSALGQRFDTGGAWCCVVFAPVLVLPLRCGIACVSLFPTALVFGSEKMPLFGVLFPSAPLVRGGAAEFLRRARFVPRTKARPQDHSMSSQSSTMILLSACSLCSTVSRS
jgi:hypothetical protein